MGILGPLVGRLYDRLGTRRLIVPGNIVVALSLWGMTLFDQSTWPGWVLIDNVTLSLGLAFIFTPLFTVSMSSVPPQLYSHASATLGTVQQLAGAAGTALFVTVMTRVSLAATPAHASYSLEVSELAHGMHAAFLCGAIISSIAIIPATLIRRASDAATLGAELQP